MNKRRIPPTGELRQSQVLTTFGPGAMIDLPNQSVLVGGLESWMGDMVRIHEERLEAWLQERLLVPELKLFAPPVDTVEGSVTRTGIAVHQFPTWFIGHDVGPLPAAATGKVDRLVLVHRLREVVAQIGFTRFDATFPDIDGELDLDVELAPLSRELTWLPAYQNRGEGVFVSFLKDAIAEWLGREAVRTRQDELEKGFATWLRQRGAHRGNFPGLPYIMLHSLAHLLITAVSLDCGYSASSIRERIYAGDAGYGILLYTGNPGSEGTLGGLVDMGKNIGRHIERALELGRLCSNDPVCAQHSPVHAHEERYLHGAACHGCLLIAETSCERRNELLDRALVVPTVSLLDAAFFLPRA